MSEKELFEAPREEPTPKPEAPQPLAVRMRPRTREEFVGQRHFFAEFNVNLMRMG